MIKLKSKIKIIPSLPTTNEEKNNIFNIILTIIILLLTSFGVYFVYTKITSYTNAIDINKITGKKTFITECNTEDYMIISSDKSFTLELTNDDCTKSHYEGSLTIKNNEVIFNKNIKGIIDNEYNILINNKMFESDTNE